MVIVPYAIDTNDTKMWVAPAMQPWDWSRYMIESFDQLHAEALAGRASMMSVGLHLRIAGRPGRIGAFAQFLEHVARKGATWVAPRGAIAEAFSSKFPPF